MRYLLEAGISQEIVHASGEGVCTWVEYGQEILKLAGIQKESQAITSDQLQRPARRPACSALRNTVLAQHGFSMRPWREALRDFMPVVIGKRGGG